MIELFYTNSIKEGLDQTNFLKSLGGYISGTKVPNDNFNNLFFNLSLIGINNIKKGIISYEIIGLGIKNSSSIKLNDINIWVEKEENSIGEFYMSIVNLSEDVNGKYMEKILNRNSSPYYATFYDINGIDKKKNIGDLIAGGLLGFWLKRIIDINKIDNLFNDDYLYNNYKNNITPYNKEIINLKIDWN